jgi:hypothetical protein
MDNMVTGWERPQEEEFALCSMGLPSPYLTMAFPNDPPQFDEYLDFEGVPRADVERWQQALLWFLRRVGYRQPGQIVLKSPPHTGRLKVLLELFPKARFVHIVRDPEVVFASTVKLWKSLYKIQALQLARYEHLEEYVLASFERMYRAFERQRSLVPPGRIVDVRYEDLVREPVEQLRMIYERLELSGFEQALPGFQKYLESVRDYQTNRHQLDPAVKAQIDRRWGPFMRQYGYCVDAAPTDAKQPARALRS